MADTDCKLAAPCAIRRIVATVGPATSTPEMLDALHRRRRRHLPAQLLAWHARNRTWRDHRGDPRGRSSAARRIVAILQDLAGPKIRTGRLDGGQPIPLAKGDRLTIRTGDEVGRPGEVFTTYAPLAASVVAGQQLLLDDGRIVLQVESTDGVEHPDRRSCTAASWASTRASRRQAWRCPPKG